MENENDILYLNDANFLITEIGQKLNDIEKIASKAGPISVKDEKSKSARKRRKKFKKAAKNQPVVDNNGYILLDSNASQKGRIKGWDEEDMSYSDMILADCINCTQNLTTVCWMGGAVLQNQLIKDQESFFTRIFNYITRTTAKGPIIVEFLKLFEIMMRDNIQVIVAFMGKSKNLSDKLQNLLNQSLHKDAERLIRRWILKILYVYTIHQDELRKMNSESFGYINLDYDKKKTEYDKMYNKSSKNIL